MTPRAPSPTALPTALVLASGRGERFLASGGQTHKLRAPLAGKAVLDHVLDAVRASGLPWHLEDAGHPGMGDAIAAAVRATPNANGWLIVLGDLPLVQAATLRTLAATLVDAAGQAQVVIPTYMGQRGHPVGFSRVCGDLLAKLEGNRGAAPVIIAYSAIEMVVSDIGVVMDVDTLDDLRRAENLLRGTA